MRWNIRPRSRKGRRVAAGVLILLAWFAVHTIAICLDGLNDEDTRADIAVIFGNKVMETGQPSPRLQARLDRGIELYRDGLVKKLFVSGGVGREGFDESAVMRDYLVLAGVPGRDILVDPDGLTTERTAANAARVMAKHGFSSAVAVTQYHHITRAKLALRKAGLRTATGASPAYFEFRDLYSIAREFLAYYRYLLT